MLGLGAAINRSGFVAGDSFVGLLNESFGGGAAAAYSVRRLSSSASTAMTIRRDSDQSETDIGFVDGNLDEAAINTFCTGTTCTVSVWKDQSGNDNHAAQTTAAKQPTIYTGGAIVKEKGKPAIDINDHHLLFGSTLSFSSDFTQFLVTKKDLTNNSGSEFLHNGTAGTAKYAEGFGGGGLPVLANRLGSQYVIHSSLNNNFAMDTADQQKLIFANRRGTTGAAALDGSAEKTATASLTGTVSYEAILGSTGGGFHSYDGLAQEAIFYASDKSTDRTSIESNIGDYFTQNTPLLDTYTGAAAAFSLRKLRSAYSGSAIRVRRASDNAESDIGFNVFGELDTVSLASFCSGTDGFAVTWYDQASTNDATQTNTANQPKIYDSVTGVVTENGKPAVDYSAGNILQTSSITLVAQPTTRISIATTASPLYAQGEGFQDGTSTNRQQVGYDVGANWRIYAGSVSSASFGPVAGNTYLMFGLFNGSNSSLYVDSSLIYSANVGSDGFDGVSLGGGISGSIYGRVSGKIQETIIYASDQSSNRTNIEDNINTFYSIY